MCSSPIDWGGPESGVEGCGRAASRARDAVGRPGQGQKREGGETRLQSGGASSAGVDAQGEQVVHAAGGGDHSAVQGATWRRGRLGSLAATYSSGGTAAARRAARGASSDDHSCTGGGEEWIMGG